MRSRPIENDKFEFSILFSEKSDSSTSFHPYPLCRMVFFVALKRQISKCVTTRFDSIICFLILHENYLVISLENCFVRAVYRRNSGLALISTQLTVLIVSRRIFNCFITHISQCCFVILRISRNKTNYRIAKFSSCV